MAKEIADKENHLDVSAMKRFLVHKKPYMRGKEEAKSQVKGGTWFGATRRLLKLANNGWLDVIPILGLIVGFYMCFTSISLESLRASDVLTLVPYIIPACLVGFFAMLLLITELIVTEFPNNHERFMQWIGRFWLRHFC